MRGRAGAGREKSAGEETCPCGRGSVWEEGSLLVRRPVHAGEGERGERESAGGEICPCGGGRAWGGESAGDGTCPCGGGRAWGEGSLLAMRLVHAGEGERAERGW